MFVESIPVKNGFEATSSTKLGGRQLSITFGATIPDLLKFVKHTGAAPGLISVGKCTKYR